MKKNLASIATATTLWVGVTDVAWAHPGHDRDSLSSALLHAFSGEHLLLLSVVGLALAVATFAGRRMRRGTVRSTHARVPVETVGPIAPARR